MPRISVAMATCQGERWVAQQLQSILAQTRTPDQVVACDDASADGTVGLVRALAAGAATTIEITLNASRLGVSANFERAIRACDGDIIVLADQDDVWAPSKLARIEAAFSAQPSLGVMFSNAALIDSSGAPRGETLWHRVGMPRGGAQRFAAGHGVDVLLRQNVVTGATMAFRAELRDLVLPLPSTGYHDAWIALLAAAIGPVLAVDEPLVDYRLHGENTAGLPAADLLGRIAARRKRTRVHQEAEAFFQLALDRLREHGVGDNHAMAALRAKAAHLRFRGELSGNPLQRALPVMLHAVRGDYNRYSREGPRSAAFDLIYG
jgi:glycosyltransferase involved in cell wall biosynthesis